MAAWRGEEREVQREGLQRDIETLERYESFHHLDCGDHSTGIVMS